MYTLTKLASTCTYHNSIMYESASHVIRPKAGVLFGSGHGNIPDVPPGVVERGMDGVGT